MIDGIPIIIQIILVVAGAVGIRELMAIGYRHFLGKPRSAAEIEGIHVSNTAAALDEIREMMDLVRKLREEADADKAVIRALKDDRIADRDKLNRAGGVIEEQRQEMRALHQELAEIRVREKDKDDRITVLEKKVKDIERQNEEILRENYQLKGMQGAK
jgi:chromosome segregation ATPase